MANGHPVKQGIIRKGYLYDQQLADAGNGYNRAAAGSRTRLFLNPDVVPVFPVPSAEHALDIRQVCSSLEIELLSKVGDAAERAGKPVAPLVAAAKDPYCAIVLIAEKLRSSRIVLGRSPCLRPEDEARRLGRAWEELPERIP